MLIKLKYYELTIIITWLLLPNRKNEKRVLAYIKILLVT